MRKTWDPPGKPFSPEPAVHAAGLGVSAELLLALRRATASSLNRSRRTVGREVEVLR
jgi:hypothetical protein